MSLDEQHNSYFSKRIRLGDITSPKECLGMKERTIEVTLGNTEQPIIFKNPKDVADVKRQDMKEMILDMFKITDEIAKERDFQFVDKYKKETEKEFRKDGRKMVSDLA